MDNSGTRFIAAIADGSPESSKAVLYAAIRAAAMQVRLLLLATVEPPDGVHWPSVDEEMRALAREEARDAAAPLIVLAEAELGAPVWFDVREGHLREAMRAALTQFPGILELVLASASTGNPGPLVSAIGRGERFGPRPVPVVIVPGALSDDEIRAIAR